MLISRADGDEFKNSFSIITRRAIIVAFHSEPVNGKSPSAMAASLPPVLNLRTALFADAMNSVTLPASKMKKQVKLTLHVLTDSIISQENIFFNIFALM